MLHSETLTVLDVIPPVSSATAVSGAWVSVADVAHFLAAVLIGAITATGTVNAKLEQATSSGGAGAKDITGKAITQLADTADNTNMLINCDASDLDMAGGFTFVRLTITPATAAALLSGVILGGNQRYQPKGHAASVTQVIA